MNKKMHARTMALVLATTTLLQVTGVTSQLLNGVSFEVANAAEGPLGQTITQSGFEVITESGVIATDGEVTIQSLITAFEGSGEPSTIKAILQFTTDNGETISAYADASVAYNNGTATVTATTFRGFYGDYTINQTFSQDITVNTLSSATTPASVEIKSEPGGLYALLEDEYGFDITSIPGATYTWYKDNIALTTPSGVYYEVTDADEGSRFRVQVTCNGVTTTSPSVTYYSNNGLLVDIYDLEIDIADANRVLNAAVEGTTEGQYQIGSKAIFKRAIDVAQAVVDDVNTTQEQVTEAIFALYNAQNAFYQAEITNSSTNPITLASVEIKTGPNILVAFMRDENGNEIPTGPGTTYLWYKNNIALMTPDFDEYILTNQDRNSNFKVEVTCNGITTTSSSVTYYWYDNPENSPNPLPSPMPNEPEETENYSVNILGNERVGNTLSAQLMKDNVEFAETGDITYEWYGIDHRNYAPSTYGTLVGKNKTYTLVSSDLDKYIRVFVYYKGKQIAERDTRSIERRSSSSSNGSPSSNSSSSGSSSTDSSSNGSGTTSITGTATTTVTLTGDNNGATRLVDSNGQPVVGWQQINGTWYLANPTGIVQTGWQKVEGTWYLLNNNGAMATGWQQVNGAWYLLNSNGAMATGWQKVNGKWYYLYSDGSMASNTTISGYTVDASGAWV